MAIVDIPFTIWREALACIEINFGEVPPRWHWQSLNLAISCATGIQVHVHALSLIGGFKI